MMIRCNTGPIMIGQNTGPIMIGRNTGPIMIGPYEITSGVAFLYDDDSMHMVRHHHEFADIHVGHVFGYRIPTLLHDHAQRG